MSEIKEKIEEEFNEAKELVEKLVRDFYVISNKQIVELLNNEDLAGRVIASLTRRRKMYAAEKSLFVYDRSFLNKKDLLEKHLKALWVYIDFIKNYNANDYIFTEDKYILLTFIADNVNYDVIYIPYKDETAFSAMLKAKEKYLTDADFEGTKRIIIIEDESQIEDIDVRNTGLYVICDLDSGDSKYIPAK